MYFEGLLIGLFSFLIIGLFHPLVIKVEYYFGRKCWWVFLLVAIIFMALSITTSHILLSIAAGVIGFTCLWSIREILEQQERVRKGNFPLNPNRKGNFNIREEKASDHKAIRRVLEEAFGQPDEAFLVEKLRKNPVFNPQLSLIATIDEIIIGHILFIPVEIIDERGNHFPSLSLSPIAVLPDFQKKGIGSELIQKGMEIARQEKFHSIIVLGQADYYLRFGFQQASRFNICSPYPDVPEECFMAVELTPGSLKDIHGTVRYPKEFGIFQ